MQKQQYTLQEELDYINKQIFFAGHRADEASWQRLTKKARAIADELQLQYEVTGYGLKFKGA